MLKTRCVARVGNIVVFRTFTWASTRNWRAIIVRKWTRRKEFAFKAAVGQQFLLHFRRERYDWYAYTFFIRRNWSLKEISLNIDATRFCRNGSVVRLRVKYFCTFVTPVNNFGSILKNASYTIQAKIWFIFIQSALTPPLCFSNLHLYLDSHNSNKYVDFPNTMRWLYID